MMKRLILLLGLLLGCSLTALGQDYFQLGQAAFDKGDYATAISYFEKVSSSDANKNKANSRIRQAQDCQAAMQNAKTAYNKGDYKTALKYYQEVLSINSKDPNAKKGVSDCNSKLSDNGNSGNSGSGGGGSGGTTVSQPVQTTLSVSPTYVSLASKGETKTVTVTTNATWKISCSQSWCTVSKNTGNFTVSAGKNTSGSTRTAKVTVSTTDGQKSELVTVSQQPYTANLSVDPTALSFPASGGTKGVTVTSNESVSYSNNGYSFISLGKNGNTVNVTCSQNTSSTDRQGTVTFTTNDKSKSIDVPVFQEGVTQTLSVTPTSANWPYYAGSTTFYVNTNVSTYAVSVPSWCTLESKGATSFVVHRNANPYHYSEQTGTITVTAGTKSVDIPVRQDKTPVSSSSSSSSSGRTSYHRGYTGTDKLFRVGWNIMTLEMNDEFIGLGTGLLARLGRYDSMFTLVSGIRYQFLSEMTDYDSYSYSEDTYTESYLIVPLELQLNLNNWQQDKDYTVYLGGGVEYDLLGTMSTNPAPLIRLGMKMEILDMNLYVRVVEDNTVVGFGMTYFF